MTSEVKGRRSSRVLLSVAIILSGKTLRGEDFAVSGQTLVVNKHGAKIQTQESVHCQPLVEVSIPALHRSRAARITWVKEPNHREFGIELPDPANFWGIYLPPSDWEELVTDWSTVDAEPGQTLARSNVALQHAPTLTSVHPAPTTAVPATEPTLVAPETLLVPATGLEVVVRGMAAWYVPFQERTVLKRVESHKAMILLQTLVDLRVRIQVVVPEVKRIIKASTRAISDLKVEGKWLMWIDTEAILQLLD